MDTLERREWSTNASRYVLLCGAIGAALLAASDVYHADHPQPYTAAILLWLLSVFAFAAAFVPRSRAQWFSLRTAFHRFRPTSLEIVVVAVVMLIALVLRVYDLEHIPMNFGGDEGEMGLQARAFLTGALQNPFGTSWMTHQTMWFWLQSMFIGALGQSAWALRLMSALFGTLSVLTSYLLIRSMFGRALGLATAVLLAGYPFHLHFSRLAISAIADPFWTPLILLLLYKSLTTRRPGYYVAAGIASGYSQYFYHGARLIPVIVAVWLVYWFFQNRSLFFSQIRNLLTLLLAGTVTAAPLIGYYLAKPALFVEHYNGMGIIPTGWLARTMQMTGSSAAAILLDRARQMFLLFITIPDYSGFYAPGTPLLQTLPAAFFILGLGIAIWRVKDRRYFLMVAWFVLALVLGAVLINDENGSERLLTTTVPVIFFVALGVTQGAESIARVAKLKPRWQPVLAGAVVLLIAIAGYKFYFYDYAPRRTYAGDGGWMYTDMARFLAAQTGDYEAYLFGAPYDFITHGTIRYLAPNVDGMDVQAPLTGAPDFVDLSRRAIFIFTPKRPNDFQYVAAAFPTGRRIDFPRPNGDLVFYIYLVDNPDRAVIPGK